MACQAFRKERKVNTTLSEPAHSSTSISAALGMALAAKLKNENYTSIAVIGDGAITGGMAFEAHEQCRNI